MAWSKEAKKGESNFFEEGWITLTKVRCYTPTTKDGQPWESPIAGFWGVPDGSNDEIDAFRLSIGRAFEPGDADGTFIVQEEGDVTRFPSGGTKYMKLVNSAIEADVPLEGRDRTVQFNGQEMVLESRDMLMWEGLRVRIEQRENDYNFKDKETGEQVSGTSSFPVIVEFGGEKGAGATPTPAVAETNGAATDKTEAATAVALSSEGETYIGYLTGVKPLGIEPSDDLGQKAFWESARATVNA